MPGITFPTSADSQDPFTANALPKGERRFNKHDWHSIAKIQQLVKNLPPLQLPPADAYIIVETDASTKGWGGILKWRKNKGASQSTELTARYTSGVYKTAISTIDAEIMACIFSLDKFSIFYSTKMNLPFGQTVKQ